MVTTIQISQSLRKTLVERKFTDNETYEEVIWDLIEDVSELSEETKKLILAAERDVKEGKMKPLSDVKRELNV